MASSRNFFFRTLQHPTNWRGFIFPAVAPPSSSPALPLLPPRGCRSSTCPLHAGESSSAALCEIYVGRYIQCIYIYIFLFPGVLHVAAELLAAAINPRRMHPAAGARREHGCVPLPAGLLQLKGPLESPCLSSSRHQSPPRHHATDEHKPPPPALHTHTHTHIHTRIWAFSV